MARKLLPLAFVLSLVAAACAETPHPEVEFGSGLRFVPMVADSLNNAGIEPSVIVGDQGLPIVSYFSFEEQTAEGVLPQTRPVGSPSIPGVLMATVNAEGVWTRGAMALEAQIPNVQIPFAPGFDPAIADLTAENVTGLDVVVDGATFHATWGSADGLYHATGSTDPSATEQVEISRVTETTPVGPSIAVVGGTPQIAYYTSTSPSGSVELAAPSGDRWAIETVAESGGCETCMTAVMAGPDGPAVAYSDGGSGVAVATADGREGWTSAEVVADAGEGLSGVSTDDGFVLSFYESGQVTVATGTPGSFRSTAVTEVADGSATVDGAGTSIAVDDAGTLWVAWTDAAEGVRFASGDATELTPIETGADTAAGAMPSVAVTPDGATAYLAWYDTEHQDVLVGAYGEIEGLAIAEPSPEPTAPAPPVPPTDGACTQAVDGVVQITAMGIAFDTACVEVSAGEPFAIAFDNQDPVQHNVAIYPSADEVTADAALFQGELITSESVEYQPPDPLDAGEYYFQCDVHPQMNGTWNAVDGAAGGDGDGGDGGDGDGAGGGDGDGGGGGAVTVTAQNIAFDTSTIELPADTESTITFDNQDAGVQHNIAIFPSADELADPIFRGDLITGPDTIDYTIPPLEAGEYYFHCDVHPQMNGTVVVA